GGAQAKKDREPLSRQGTQAREGRHRGLRFADPLGLVDGRVSAVQEEVAERSVGVQVPAEDRLVVHLEFQVSGEGRRGGTGGDGGREGRTLAWQGLARDRRGGDLGGRRHCVGDGVLQDYG